MLSFPRSFVRRPIVIGSLRYVAAAAMTVVAVIATIVAEPWIGRTLFVFSFAVVSLCAWLLGLGPALLAAVVSVLGIDYFLIPPRGSFEPTGATDLVAIAAFALVSVLIAWLSQTARGSIKRATLQSEQLQRRVGYRDQGYHLVGRNVPSVWLGTGTGGRELPAIPGERPPRRPITDAGDGAASARHA